MAEKGKLGGIFRFSRGSQSRAVGRLDSAKKEGKDAAAHPMSRSPHPRRRCQEFPFRHGLLISRAAYRPTPSRSKPTGYNGWGWSQWLEVGVSFPLTAAGPCRIRTGFPSPKRVQQYDDRTRTCQKEICFLFGNL